MLTNMQLQRSNFVQNHLNWIKFLLNFSSPPRFWWKKGKQLRNHRFLFKAHLFRCALFRKPVISQLLTKIKRKMLIIMYSCEASFNCSLIGTIVAIQEQWRNQLAGLSSVSKCAGGMGWTLLERHCVIQLVAHVHYYIFWRQCVLACDNTYDTSQLLIESCEHASS